MAEPQATDPLDNVYEAPTEELYADREPEMVPARYFKILATRWEKDPEKMYVVTFKRVSQDGEQEVEETVIAKGAAFSQVRKRAPQAGENLGDQEEAAAFEFLVAKGRIPADSVIA